MEIEIAIAVIILLLLVFLATIDMAFTQLSDLSLRKLSTDSEESKDVFLREILINRPRFRFALSATIQILLIIFSILGTLIVSNFFVEQGTLLVLSLILGLGLAFVFRQFLPRLLTWKNPESKLLLLLPFIRPFYGVMSFLSDPLQFFTKAENPETTIIPNKKEDDEETDSDNIQALIEVGEAEGIIEGDDRELIESVFEFTETRVGEIMTPRTEICALPIDATITAARDLIIEEKYSRIPVYKERIENIEGVVYVRDLLQAWADGKENQKIETLMREAYFIPETKSASELLKVMQSNHVQIAIVVDEYGGVAGLITVEDIIEEIVGEIEDEDTEQEEVIEIIEGDGGNYFDVLGSTEIHKIERIFDLEIEDDDYTTIAGLVTSQAGYVPKKGEKLSIKGIDIEILKADEKRLQLLRLRRANEETSENNE
ncbi:MAG TPA: hemolysin family protein [Pyrinomonadaceae bacterium]|nr:hemolysin family protein [Pyrinomonadaceae bacterium]